jgi:hypothetical protein
MRITLTWNFKVYTAILQYNGLCWWTVAWQIKDAERHFEKNRVGMWEGGCQRHKKTAPNVFHSEPFSLLILIFSVLAILYLDAAVNR